MDIINLVVPSACKPCEQVRPIYNPKPSIKTNRIQCKTKKTFSLNKITIHLQNSFCNSGSIYCLLWAVAKTGTANGLVEMFGMFILENQYIFSKLESLNPPTKPPKTTGTHLNMIFNNQLK